MRIDRGLTPKKPVGEPRIGALAHPDTDRAEAERLAELAKTLADPIRVQIVDVLIRHAGRVCVCDLVPLFDISQPKLSHHLKKLREAGIVDVEERGPWAYHFVVPGALTELSRWLSNA